MTEKVEAIETQINEDVNEGSTMVQDPQPDVQTVVEQPSVDESFKANDDGVSTSTDLVAGDANKVDPVVENNINEVSTKAPESDWRLNNKYGAKTAEGATDLNSDIEYQSIFGMPTK